MTGVAIGVGAAMVVLMAFAICRGLYADSQFDNLLHLYPADADNLPEMARLQSGVINGVSFNGTLSIGLTATHLFMKPMWPLAGRRFCAIPLHAITIRDSIIYGRYTRVDIQRAATTIALESTWFEKLKSSNKAIQLIADPRHASCGAGAAPESANADG